MFRTYAIFKAALVSALFAVSAHSFAFDFTHMVMRTAGHAMSKGKAFTADTADHASSSSVPATGTIEVAFSPNEGAEALVLKAINSARSEIRMLSYSFTSAPVTRALIDAKKRGVDIKLVADYKNNVSEDRSGKSRAALSALSNAGIEVRTIATYAIHHDKVIVVDGASVELGSFNYSDAAAHRNSENVLVNWNNPQLAKVYLAHFQRNYRQSEPYKMAY